MDILEDTTAQVEQDNPWLDVVVAKRIDAATDVISLELEAVDGGLLPAYALENTGASWELHYCGRSKDRLAFQQEMERFKGCVYLHLDDGPKEWERC